MRTVKLKDSTIVGDGQKPYIIAEVNTSHFGDINIAKEMVKKAKEANCDCVKFQSWSSESINSKSFYKDNPIAGRIFKKFSLSEEELVEMANFCKEVGIAFSSTPYSKEEAEFLINKCNAPFVKVASMDLTNYPYLEYLAKTGTPIVLSTGMGDMQEIKKAVETITTTGNDQIMLLHCISIYPPELDTIRLKNINGLREEFPNYPVGFSDHSLGIEMASASIALGSNIIEKHMTLDKSRIGMDNQIALEPDELTQMVTNCHNVHMALGDEKRIVSEAELEQRSKIRRSIIVNKDLKAGATLNLEDLGAKRPGTGIPPEKMKDLVGAKLLTDIEGDTMLKDEDFE